MMFELKPEQIHAEVGDQHADRQRDDGDKRAAQMKKKEHADKRDDDAFLGERPLERADRAIDQVRTVIGRLDSDAPRQADRNLRKPVLHILDDAKCIFTEPLLRPV
jgi:hypothetical protein